MNLFYKKTDEEENFENFNTLELPFIGKDTPLPESSNEEEPKSEEAKTYIPIRADFAIEEEKNSEPETVKMHTGFISPLDAIKKQMNRNAAEIASEQPAVKTEQPAVKTEEPPKENSEIKAPISNESPLVQLHITTTKPSLLKRCMPYIYDEEGVSQVDTKPDYVLESVEDIIRSAEQRAEERIAEKYKFTDANGNTIKNITVETPATAPTPSSAEEKSQAKPTEATIPVSLPTAADILFDDFSGKKTVVTENSSVTTAYSQLTNLQTGIPDIVSSSTNVIPSVPTAKMDTMEDIVSHTRPINIKDAPAIKPTKSISISINTDDEIPEVQDDYRSVDDTRRIGMKLKKNRRSAFSSLVVSVFATIVSAIFAFIIPHNLFEEAPFVPCLVQFSLLTFSTFASFGIFSSFKGIFTKKTSAAAPVSLGVSAMLLFMLYGLIFGLYPCDPALLAILSLTAYNYFAYKRASSVLDGFRIVASKKEKKALALIDNQVTTSSMARSSIEGEVLAAGVKRTSILTNYIRFSSCDAAFGGHLGIVLTIFSIISFVFSLIVGVSHQSFKDSFEALSLMLCLFAMPTYALAEFLPHSDLAARLYKLGAMICGKYSAARIEQCNAVVISSEELFPAGSIELYSMKPLGANNIDKTLNAAASVAAAIKSPLFSALRQYVDPSENRTAADTVKYEENLGISGWVGDDHIFIGNRTLMEAHGIKVPSLEVDRKILHRGFFPVYVAVGQRACALLIVKYNPDRKVRRDLVRLVNAGMTLLIDNCDSNITAQMLSDYYAIYPDCIKIMDAKGSHNYKTTVNFSEYYSAHAAFLGKAHGYFAIISGALKLRTVSNVMYALHIVLSALILVVFLLASAGFEATLLSVGACIIIEAVALGATLVTYLFARK